MPRSEFLSDPYQAAIAAEKRAWRIVQVIVLLLATFALGFLSGFLAHRHFSSESRNPAGLQDTKRYGL